MRDKASPGTWLSWLTVSVGGAAMVGVFALAGGVGSGPRGVASAVAADTSSSATAASGGAPTVSGISTPTCAGSSLTGAIRVSDKFQGTVTVGLFVISDPKAPVVRSFTDTGLRATVTFNHAFSGPFTFPDVPQGSGGFLIAVIPSSGTIDPNTQLAESQVIPSCNTVTTTLTDTTTVTALTTTNVTTTQVTYVTVTERIVSTTSECIIPIFPSGFSAPRPQTAINPCFIG